ncbi:MAG: hypothetical protein NT099_02825, partial [Candidatus Saganbacteria bacterium]|nr:hypothetical protein [Candidatus Saganbacteria bacterium]
DAMLRVYDIRVPSGEPEVDPTTGKVRQPTEVQTLSGKQLVWILDKKFDKAGVSKARGEFVLGILLQPGNKPAGYDGHMQQIKMHLAALYFITLNSSFDLEYEMTRWASGKDLDKTYKFKVLNEKTGKTETVERKGRILKANIERNVEGTQTATDQDASLTNSLVGNRNPDNLRGYLDGTTQKTEKGPTLFDRQIEALNMYEAFARSHGLESVVRGLEYLSKGAPLIGGPSGRVGAVGVRTGSDALSGFVVGMAIGLFNELTDDKPGVNWWGKHGVMSKAGESAFEWGRFGAIAGSSEVFLGWSKWAGMGAGLAFPTMLQLANSKTPDSAKGQILANGVAGGAGLAGGMGLLEIPGVARIKKIPFVGGILGTAIAIGAALGLGKVNEWAYNKFEGYRDVVDSRFMRGLGSSIGEGSHLSFVSWGAGALKGFTTSFSALNNLTESLLTETGFTATGAVAGGTGFWGGARAGLKAFMKPTVGASGLLGAFGAVTGGAALAQMGIEAWFQISNGEYEQSMAQRIGSQIYDHFYDSGEIGPNWIIKVIGGDGKFDQVLENSAKYYDDFSILDQRAITQRTSRVLGKDFDMSLDSADAVVDFYSSAMLGSGSTYANAGELAAGIEIEATALTSEVYFTPQERAMFQAVIKFASNNKIGSLDDPRLVDTLLSTDVTDLDVLAWLKDTTVDKGCNSDGPDNDCDGIEDEDYMAPETVGKKYMQFASRQEAAAQLARFRNYLIQQQVKGIMMVDPSQMGKDLYGLVNYYVNEHPKQVAEIEAAGEACAPKNPSAITMAIMKKLQLDMVINDRGLQDFERKVEQGRRYGKSRIQVFEQYFSEYAPRIIPELRAAGVPEADLDKAGRQVMLEILAVADPYKQFASFQCKRDAAFHMDEEHPENKVRFTSGNPFKDTSVMKMNDVQTLHDEIAQFFDEKGRLLPGKEKEFTAWVLNHKIQTKEGAKTMAQEMQQQEARIKEIKVKRTAQLMVAQQIIGRFFALVRDQQAGRALQPEQVDIEFGLVRKNSADKWEINPESDFYKAWQATATKGTRTLEVRPGFTPPVPTPCAPEDNNIQQVFKQIVGADDVRFGVVTENGVLIETTAAYLQATMELIDNMASEGEAFNAVSIVKGLWEKGAIDEQVFNELMDKIIDAMFERFNESEQLAFNPNTGVFDIQSYGISPVASFIVGKNSAEIDYQASRKALLATIAEIQGVADSLAGYRNKVFDAQAKKEIRDKHVRIAELFFMLGDEARFNEASKVVCAVEDLPVLPGEEDIDHTCGKAVAAKK